MLQYIEKECCKCCLAWNSSVVDKSALIKMAKNRFDELSTMEVHYVICQPWWVCNEKNFALSLEHSPLPVDEGWPWLANNTFWRFFSTVLLWKLVLCQIFIKGIQLRSGVHMGLTFWAQKVILFAQFCLSVYCSHFMLCCSVKSLITCQSRKFWSVQMGKSRPLEKLQEKLYYYYLEIYWQ